MYSPHAVETRTRITACLCPPRATVRTADPNRGSMAFGMVPLKRPELFPERIVLPLWLLIERERGERSDWFGYIQSLPMIFARTANGAAASLHQPALWSRHAPSPASPPSTPLRAAHSLLFIAL